MCFQSLQCLYAQSGSRLCQFIMKAAAGLFGIQHNLGLQQHIAGIQTGIHLHGGNSGYLLPVHHRPLDGGSAPVLRQQRRMDVDAAIGRHVQDLLGQDLSKRDHHHHVSRIFFQFFDIFRVPDLLWLKNRDPMGKGCLLYRRILHVPAAALWLVGLRHCQHHLMAGLDQRLQRSH